MNSDKIVLVTGGSGYLGTQCIIALLKQGYTVKTTLRSLSKKEAVLEALKEAGITAADQVSFYEADLTNDKGWDQAVQNCMYVLHVASPFPGGEVEHEEELIVPARDGALRVLKAARNAGVKRVVLTSSFAAIGYSIYTKNHVFTEEDWTDLSNPNTSARAYIKSKTIAEMAAWDFIAEQGNGLELAVINPVAILGPVLGNNFSASIQVVIKGILDGEIKETPGFTLGIVDVRDVVDLHLKAMENPLAKGERFLASSDGVMSFYDIAQFIKKKRGDRAAKIADLNPIDQSLYIKMSNNKSKSLLGWNPRTKEEAILATVDSLSN